MAVLKYLLTQRNISNLKIILLDWMFKNKLKAVAILYAFYIYMKRLLKKPRNLEGKVVLITGSASGLGANLAKRFAKLGCTLVLWDLVKGKEEARPNRAGKIRYLDKVKQEIEANQHSGDIFTYKVNLTDKKQIKDVSNQTNRDLIKLGQKRNVDIVINNAGIVSGDYITDIDDESIERTFAVNTLA